jgi:probable HAF family extracellular repeat protein
MVKLRRLLVVGLAVLPATAATAWSATAAGPDASSDRGGRGGYDVRVLKAISGTDGNGQTLNNRGVVSGHSTTADGEYHATVWGRDGKVHDLGTLGGAGTSSAVVWPSQNERGLVVGISQTDKPDPNNEPWSCSRFLPRLENKACSAFAYYNGKMHALPSLGGTHSFGTSVNNRGQIVGWAENNVKHPDCTDGQVLQFKAVRWDGLGRKVTALEPLPGDSASAATAINNKGVVAGISGSCDKAEGRYTARKVVVWKNGYVKALPDTGGVAWNTPMAINDRGEIVGYINRDAAADAALKILPAAWSPKGDLTVLPLPQGFTLGQATALNERGQIVGVGFSEDFSKCAPLLWDRNRVINLAEKLDAGSDLNHCYVNDINEGGDLSGAALTPAGGAVSYVAYKR